MDTFRLLIGFVLIALGVFARFRVGGLLGLCGGPILILAGIFAITKYDVLAWGKLTQSKNQPK